MHSDRSSGPCANRGRGGGRGVIWSEDNRHYEKSGNNAPICIEDELPFEIPESWEWVRLGNAYNRYYEHIDKRSKDEAIEVPFDLPDNWEWARWGDVSYSIQYGYNAPAKTNGHVKMVRISDIHNNKVDWANVPFCDIDEEDISTYLLRENDILFARTGGTVGKSYLVTVVPEKTIYAGYLIRTRYSKDLSAQYLKYFMESQLYWAQLRDGTIATAQPNCNGQTLSKMMLPIPPLAEQKRIVDKINKIFAKL